MNTTPELHDLLRRCRAAVAYAGNANLVRDISAALSAPTPPAASAGLVEAVRDYLEAQDALDNREYMGQNGDPWCVLQPRVHAARRDLEDAIAAHDAAAEQPVPVEGCMLLATLSEHATLQPAPADELPDHSEDVRDMVDELPEWDTSIIKLALHRLVSDGYSRAFEAGQDREGRFFQPGDATKYVDDAKRAERKLAAIDKLPAVAADRAGRDVFADGSPAQKAFWEGYESCLRDDGGRPGNIRLRWNQYKARAAMNGGV